MKVRAEVVFAANEPLEDRRGRTARPARGRSAGPHAGGGPLRDLRNI